MARNNLKKLLIGLAIVLPILYMMFFHIVALIAISFVLGLLVLAYGIGDILLMEYYWWK